MVLEKPKVEFVPIDLSQSIMAGSNSCTSSTTEIVLCETYGSDTYVGGGDVCVGSGTNAWVCEDFVSNMPW